MKKLVHITILIAIQHLALSTQNSYAQAPNDNRGSGNCFDFDGTNDFVEINATSDFDFGTGNFTVSFWCTFNGATSSRVAVARMNQCGLGDGFKVQCTSAGNIYGLIGARAVVGTTNIQDGNWHHVTMVRDGGDMYIYVDGKLDGSRNDLTGQVATAQNNPNLHIGAGNPYTDFGTCNHPVNKYWPGQLDEVRIWNTARTQAQIQDNMCKTLEGNETGLVSYWNMNEGTGNTVNDLTSNANHGTRQ